MPPPEGPCHLEVAQVGDCAPGQTIHTGQTLTSNRKLPPKKQRKHFYLRPRKGVTPHLAVPGDPRGRPVAPPIEGAGQQQDPQPPHAHLDLRTDQTNTAASTRGKHAVAPSIP
eukprot:scaffold103762_cov33-Prasinocladus_malaysianus.AAC.2